MRAGFAASGRCPDSRVVHGVQDPSPDGFQAVSNVGNSPAGNHTHGVVDVLGLRLVLDVDWLRWIEVRGHWRGSGLLCPQ